MKFIDQNFYQALTEKAKASPRLRANENFHEKYDDPVQRLFIAMEPGSYVRPHRHNQDEKWEFFFVAKGRLAFFIFDDDGRITKKFELVAGESMQGLEIPPYTWHSTVSLESGTVFFEVKQGPYVQVDDKGFASWAPEEGSVDCGAFLSDLLAAKVGDYLTSSSAR